MALTASHRHLCDLEASAKKPHQICLSFQHVDRKITPISRNICVGSQGPDILALQASIPRLLQLFQRERESLGAGQRKEFCYLSKQRLPNIEIQNRAREVYQKIHTQLKISILRPWWSTTTDRALSTSVPYIASTLSTSWNGCLVPRARFARL